MELRSHFTVCDLSDVSNWGRGIRAAAPYLLHFISPLAHAAPSSFEIALMSISRLRLRKCYGLDLTLKLQLTRALHGVSCN
jgi:hypothetical protein